MFVKYGDPKKWTNSNVYQKWCSKEKFDVEFVKKIEEEVNTRGGLKLLKRDFELEKQKKEAEYLIRIKKKKRIKIISTSILTIFLLTIISLLVYDFMTREEKAYHSAIQSDSEYIYVSYLEKFPEGEHYDQIKNKYIKKVILNIFIEDYENPLTTLEKNIKLNKERMVDEFVDNLKTELNIIPYNKNNTFSDLADVLGKGNLIVEGQRMMIFLLSLKSTKVEVKNSYYVGLYDYTNNFNKKCIERLKEDKILKDFFEQLLEDNNQLLNSNININDLNYYGVAARGLIENKLGLERVLL